MKAITKGPRNCPFTIRCIFSKVFQKAKTHFPEEPTAGYVAVTSFLFLRFFGAALLNPLSFGLSAENLSPKTRRTLTILSKIIQKAANFQEFDSSKEAFTAKLNRFVPSYHPTITVFINELCKVRMEPSRGKSAGSLKLLSTVSPTSGDRERSDSCFANLFRCFGSQRRQEEFRLTSAPSLNIFTEAAKIEEFDYEDLEVSQEEISKSVIDTDLHLAALCRHLMRCGEKLILHCNRDDEINLVYHTLNEIKIIYGPLKDRDYGAYRRKLIVKSQIERKAKLKAIDKSKQKRDREALPKYEAIQEVIEEDELMQDTRRKSSDTSRNTSIRSNGESTSDARTLETGKPKVDFSNLSHLMPQATSKLTKVVNAWEIEEQSQVNSGDNEPAIPSDHKVFPTFLENGFPAPNENEFLQSSSSTSSLGKIEEKLKFLTQPREKLTNSNESSREDYQRSAAEGNHMKDLMDEAEPTSQKDTEPMLKSNLSSKSSMMSLSSKSKTLSESRKNFLKTSKSSLKGSDSEMNVFKSKSKTLLSNDNLVQDQTLLRVAMENENMGYPSPMSSPGEVYDMYHNSEIESRQPTGTTYDNKIVAKNEPQIPTVNPAISAEDILNVYSSDDSVLKDIPIILNPDKQPSIRKPSIDFNDLLGSIPTPTQPPPSAGNKLATTAKAIAGLMPKPMERKPSRILTEVLTASSQSVLLTKTLSFKNTADQNKSEQPQQEDLIELIKFDNHVSLCS